MNQSQFLAITCNSLEAPEKSRVRGVIGFGLASHWLKKWQESFEPITKRSNRGQVISFDSHLKTALKKLSQWIVVRSVFSLKNMNVPSSYLSTYQSQLADQKLNPRSIVFHC